MNHPIPLLDRMYAQADTWEAGGDKRYIFLRCYSLMTGSMLEGLKQGRFQDPVWVENLLHAFADYYFDALVLYEGGYDHTPPVWKQAHDISRQKGVHVMQHLLLGVNAHINYDLVLVLYDELCQDWSLMDEAQREVRRTDHRMVNNIIAETIDIVQDNVVERAAPFMALVDTLMGRVDEWLLSELITGWRTAVWNDACRMLAATDDIAREELRLALEKKVMAKATKMLVI